MLLENKVAIVTGAGRGIGSEIARMFAGEGAHVAVHYHHSRDTAEQIADKINGIAVQADLTNVIQVQSMVDAVIAHYGHIDILVNNASSFAHDIDFDKSEWQDYEAEFKGVVGATINTSKAVVPFMKKQQYGRIINTLATLLQRPAIEHIVHTTAKSALLGFTRTLARDVGPFGITVNLVSPGMTLTDYSNQMPDDLKDKIAKQTPLRRLAQPEDVAKIAVFYASPLADFITSANIAPDGGLAIL